MTPNEPDGDQPHGLTDHLDDASVGKFVKTALRLVMDGKVRGFVLPITLVAGYFSNGIPQYFHLKSADDKPPVPASLVQVPVDEAAFVSKAVTKDSDYLFES